jgi:predicted nucleic acid-binding protein
MARYLLDTPILIDLSREHRPTQTGLRDLFLSGDEVGVCGVIVAEFFASLPRGERPRWLNGLRLFEFWDISQAAALRAGTYQADFREAGRTLSTTDALIAAVAWDQDAVLLTADPEDFPMTDIEVRLLRP